MASLGLVVSLAKTMAEVAAFSTNKFMNLDIQEVVVFQLRLIIKYLGILTLNVPLEVK